MLVQFDNTNENNCATKKLLALGLNENSLIGHTSLAEMLEEYDRRLQNSTEEVGYDGER